MVARWSPDGRHLAFVSDRDGNGEIYVLDLASDEAINLTRNSADDAAPNWSPDGEHIAFVSNRGTGTSIYVADFATINDESETAPILLASSLMSEMDPAWSPDGRYVAFRSNRDGVGKLYMIDIEDGETRSLTDDGIDQWPKWSADGRHLLYFSTRDGNNEVYIMNMSDVLDGLSQQPLIRNLTNNPARDTAPAWFPGWQ